MATSPLADGPGVMAGPAHDLPGSDGDGVVLTVAIHVPFEMDPLGRSRVVRVPSLPVSVTTPPSKIVTFCPSRITSCGVMLKRVWLIVPASRFRGPTRRGVSTNVFCARALGRSPPAVLLRGAPHDATDVSVTAAASARRGYHSSAHAFSFQKNSAPPLATLGVGELAVREEREESDRDLAARA
jgi:hypothetical protein